MTPQPLYPIRVAHIIGKVLLGGVDVMVMNYYRHMDYTKVQFDFFIEGLEPTPIDEEILALGGRVYRLPLYTDNLNKNLKCFRKILAQNQYKVVHSHMNSLSVFWLREAKRANVPIRIAHSHSTAHWGEVSRTLMKYLLRPVSQKYATHFYACGEHAGRWLFGNRSFNAGKVNVIPYGIELDQFKYDPHMRDKIRGALGLHDKFVVGHIGRFVYQKNHKAIVMIFARVLKNKPNALLMLIGEGELKAEIEHMVESMGIKDSVLFLGLRKDVNELYHAMDVFLLPSFYEGFGIVALEAQTAGLPCFVSEYVPDEAIVVRSLCKQLPVKNKEDVDVWCEAILKTSKDDLSNRTYDTSLNIYNITENSKKLYPFKWESLLC